MLFVKEVLPAEVRETVHRWSLDRAGQDKVSLTWVINRARNVYLLCYSFGRVGPGPSAMRGRYALSVAGAPVLFQSQPDLLKDERDPEGYIRFTIYELQIPAELAPREQEIKDLIAAALAMSKSWGSGRTEVEFFGAHS